MFPPRRLSWFRRKSFSIPSCLAQVFLTLQGLRLMLNLEFRLQQQTMLSLNRSCHINLIQIFPKCSEVCSSWSSLVSFCFYIKVHLHSFICWNIPISPYNMCPNSSHRAFLVVADMAFPQFSYRVCFVGYLMSRILFSCFRWNASSLFTVP